jgi:hypothetical protein
VQSREWSNCSGMAVEVLEVHLIIAGLCGPTGMK